MNHDTYADSYLAAILERVSTVAVVGASPNPARPSYHVMETLLHRGYVVTPVNPGHDGEEILGCRVYAALGDIPGPVDMVDIFRNSAAALDVVRDVVRLGPKLGASVVWMQLGVRNDEAAREAEAAGIDVVMNRCPAIELARLSRPASRP